MDKSEYETLYAKFVEAYNAKKYKEALTYVDKLVEKKPIDEHIWLMRADCFFLLKDYKKAVSNAKVAHNLNPKPIESLKHLTKYHRFLDKHDESEKYAKRAYKLNKNDPTVIWNMARSMYYRAYIKFSKNNYKQTRIMLKEILDLCPSFAPACVLDAKMFLNEHEYEKCIVSCQQAIDVDKESYSAYSYMNDCYLELKEYKKSLAICLKWIQIYKNDEYGTYKLAEAYYNMHNYDKALLNIKKALKFNSTNTSYMKLMHLIYDNIKSNTKKIMAD
ncbi:MAG: hypothetical protein Ta2E_02980 [Mycoplasmoidaceae bacterium]|nr:MAG: hypothetical protein Ta2E_02980 [Mycoplasmoidaceae bacterium]